ncbi:transporter substrate-binding domain-containing protein [Komagataeibacter xylinus]|nr:transporter substrate-binding domain-containing protein [Komagataeibacter xylinus]GBQ74030.1 extracellular substrate-binding protein [Komagataeibacter xylinus NBRC 15237]
MLGIMVRLACLVGIMFVALPAGPAWARSLDEILHAGTIRVGINPTLPPLALFDEKNELVGFDVDLAQEVASKLGVKLEIVQVSAPDRVPFVASGRVDVVLGGMTRDTLRAKVIDFSVPINSENYGIITREDKSFSKLSDLDNDNITLVQVRGGAVISFIQKNLPKAHLILLDNYNDRDRALAQGRGDASFDRIDSMEYRLKIFPAIKWKIIPSPEFGVTYSGFGMEKGNYSLRDWLNIALYELHTSGMIETLWEKWFLRPMDTKVPVTPYF